ncbi:MAG: MFS transporter [Planctomycetota bacterium]
MTQFFSFVADHWDFCLLHFLQFAIWGAWIVVLGNLLEHRGFSRVWIGRIYGAVPLGAILSTLFVGTLADRYFEVQHVLAVAHFVGAMFLFGMAFCHREKPFFALSLGYAFFFAPTLVLVNAIVFKNDQDIFAGQADSVFPWIRVFGTIGWIAAGLSHVLILKKGQPVNERPLLLAGALSLAMGAYSLGMPSTPPTPPEGEVLTLLQSAGKVFTDAFALVADSPAFFGVTLVAATAMGLYFAFAALYLEKSGVPARTVGPVMTIGQWIEIFFLLTLPWFLGEKEKNMNWVLLVGIAAWAFRFGLFAIGRPIGLVLFGVAIHGVCFDFFFGAGFINANKVASEGLTASAQGVYAFLVYGVGMYVGSELSGWFNGVLTRQVDVRTDGTDFDGTVSDGMGSKDIASDAAAQPDAPDAVLATDSVTPTTESETDWKTFWAVPCAIVGVAALIFAVTVVFGETPAP